MTVKKRLDKIIQRKAAEAVVKDLNPIIEQLEKVCMPLCGAHLDQRRVAINLGGKKLHEHYISVIKQLSDGLARSLIPYYKEQIEEEIAECLSELMPTKRKR